jgi:hypothetical protein
MTDEMAYCKRYDRFGNQLSRQIESVRRWVYPLWKVRYLKVQRLIRWSRRSTLSNTSQSQIRILKVVSYV